MLESRGEPEVRISIRIRYNRVPIAKAILEATSPDNFKAPSETIIESKLQGSEIIFNVTSAKSIGSLISTVDDLLSCVQAAEKAIDASNIIK